MSDQPDKLFREKLYGYERPVPARAWSQVSANLKGARSAVWWRSVAAITLFCVAGLAIYPLSRRSQSEIAQPVTKPADETASPLVMQRPENKQDPRKEAHKPAVTPPALSEAQPVKKTTPVGQTSPAMPPSKKADNIVDDLPMSDSPAPEPVAHIDQIPHTPTEQIHDQVDASTRKHVTIVFTAAEVNEKYLSKTHQADATSGDQETSRLKNMLEKAYDLTHNQDPIGDLRQKKNEILAMNFRKPRPNTEND